MSTFDPTTKDWIAGEVETFGCSDVDKHNANLQVNKQYSTMHADVLLDIGVHRIVLYVNVSK